jgi:Leucine-rich repeat (LRR) protein
MLSALSITGCGFTTLNIPATLHLSELICNENNLTSLDLSGQIHLTSLQCDDNNLTSLKLPTSLWKLFCRNNRLTSLDLSGNDMLDMVYCGGNLLTSLDASDCQTLGTLSCEDNPGDGESKFPVKVWLDEDGEMYYDGISVPEPWVYGDATIAVELEM